MAAACTRISSKKVRDCGKVDIAIFGLAENRSVCAKSSHMYVEYDLLNREYTEVVGPHQSDRVAADIVRVTST